MRHARLLTFFIHANANATSSDEDLKKTILVNDVMISVMDLHVGRSVAKTHVFYHFQNHGVHKEEESELDSK